MVARPSWHLCCPHTQKSHYELKVTTNRLSFIVPSLVCVVSVQNSFVKCFVFTTATGYSGEVGETGSWRVFNAKVI